jgi:benzoyl-CoA reductase/2-hydroxyglutaryl-CoA dehydratase subunit BcrC/BadD/HgdB
LPVCLCGGSADTIPAAEEELPGMLCPLIKSTYGYLITKENPFLEMAALVVAETTCDGKKKMYELMAERIPMHLVELPQRENSPEAFELWLAELRRLRAGLEERFGVTITDDKLREAIRTMNRERQSRMALADLLKQECPPISGRQLLELKSLISGNPEDLAEYDRLLALLKDARGPAELAKRTRVLLTGVPMPHGAERVIDLIEESGGLIVSQENCTGVKPLVEMVDETAADPLAAIARKYFHLPCSVMTPNLGRFDLLRQLVADYRPDCIVEVVWQACLTYDVEALRVKRLAHELGLGYLRINTDYSPSDSARIAIRIEALFETVQHNRHKGE